MKSIVNYIANFLIRAILISHIANINYIANRAYG